MPNFSFHGGSVISYPDITIIYARTQNVKEDGSPDFPTWIDSTNNLNIPINLVCIYNKFIYDLIDSTYMDLLAKTYSAPNHAFGRGTFNTSVIIDLPFKQRTGSTILIDYKDIETMIDNAIQTGTLALPTQNSIYIVLVENIQVSVPNSTNVVGVQAGGFHNPFQLSSGMSTVYCLVENNEIPFITTQSISHELAECITDPYLDGWYDINGKEICDICPPPGRYTVNEIIASGSMYHGNLVSKFWSDAAGSCIAPPDDNIIKQGPHLVISDTRFHSDSCTFGYVEGTEVTFTVKGVLDKKSIPIIGIFWTEQFAEVVNINNDKFTIRVPAAGESFQITATAIDNWGCIITVAKTFLSISQKTIQLQQLICKMRHEILVYWRFINPLWDPLRDFVTKPVSIFEINALNSFAKQFRELHDLYRNLDYRGFNDHGTSHDIIIDDKLSKDE